MAAVIASPEDLKVQQRIDSESLSAAFEQSLSRGGEDFSLAGRETGSPEVTQPVRGRKGISIQLPKGYEDDTLSLQDDSEESWLISSPGPASTKSQLLDVSPPSRGGRGGMRKQAFNSTQKSPEALIPSDENGGGQYVRNGISAANRSAGSPTKKPTKIPRVAMLAKNTSGKAANGLGAPKVPNGLGASKPASPSPSKLAPSPAKASSPGPKKVSSVKYDLNGRVIQSGDSGLTAGSRIPKRDSAQPAKSVTKGPVKSPGKASPTKASLVHERSIDAERENPGNSRIPSRPGSAAVRGGRRPSTAGMRRGKPGSKTTAAENGSENEAQLLTAISGPEEDLIAAVPAAEEHETLNPTAVAGASPPAAKSPEARDENLNPSDEAFADGVADTNSATSLRSRSPEVASGIADETAESGRIVGGSANGTAVPGNVLAEPANGTAEAANGTAEAADGDSGTQPSAGADNLQEKPSGSVRMPAPKIPASPFAGGDEKVDEGDEGADESAPTPAAVMPTGDEERPGVGRKKADELPDKGYHTADKTQKGCCGCVVM